MSKTVAPTSPFFSGRQNLLRVQAGIPIDEAYDQVSILLGYIKHLIREGDMEADHKLLGAAEYLRVLAKALMNDIEIAKNRLL